jgi:hypothetical protein
MKQFRFWYIYMWKCHKEIPCIYVLDKQKCHFFKQNMRIGGQNDSCLGSWYQWKGEDLGKECRRVNMVQILCKRLCKWKNENCWNYSRNGERGIKGTDGGDEFNYDNIVSTLINVTMYPQHNDKKINKNITEHTHKVPPPNSPFSHELIDGLIHWWH